MIDFNCEHCGETLSVPQSVAGTSEKCPACGEEVTIPNTSRPVVLSGWSNGSTPKSKRGICKLCGQKVRLWGQVHKECKDRHDRTWNQLVQLSAEAIRKRKDLAALAVKLSEFSKASFITTHEMRKALVVAWDHVLGEFLEDAILSKEEENALMVCADKLGLAETELDANGAWTRATMAATLREVLDGKLPSRLAIRGQVPFVLQKAETLIWAFPGTDYYEERARTTYEGGYQGVSIRVMKGVYYRTGGFRGHPVVTNSLVHIDAGMFGITNKHLYFAGDHKGFRIPYRKIVSYRPHSDGIGINRDAASAKPQVFVTGEGWFVHNLATNLAKMALA